MTTTTPPEDVDPVKLMPFEAAIERLAHWWREPLAGILALSIGTYDAWYFPRDQGLSPSLDEALVIGGVVLIAGSRKLFGAVPVPVRRENGDKP
jgi:hypothetical protein